MIQCGGHGEINPNASWLGSRGMWIMYALAVAFFHFFLLSIPFTTIPIAWTLTNLLHNLVSFYLLHILKGAPWILQDQGVSRRLTHWEQIDYGVQYTRTRKFLAFAPIALFMLTSFYTRYEPNHLLLNFISLVVVLVPKLPQFHCVRLFGINKY